MDMFFSSLGIAMLAAAFCWLASFWPRYVADTLGQPFGLFIRHPLARGLKPYRDNWPFISFGFYRFVIKRGHVLEMILALIAFVMVARALSVFWKAAGAVARSQG
jgi:hypothetical protein